jgi:hypothetical protein
VHPAEADAGVAGEVAEPPGRGVPVHPLPACVQEERSGISFASGPFDGPTDGERHRGQDDLAAFAADSQYAVAVLLTEVLDIRADRFKDPQSKEAEEAH